MDKNLVPDWSFQHRLLTNLKTEWLSARSVHCEVVWVHNRHEILVSERSKKLFYGAVSCCMCENISCPFGLAGFRAGSGWEVRFRTHWNFYLIFLINISLCPTPYFVSLLPTTLDILVNVLWKCQSRSASRWLVLKRLIGQGSWQAELLSALPDINYYLFWWFL